jgi:hypothetical protein
MLPDRQHLADEFAISARLFSEAVVALTLNQSTHPHFEDLLLAEKQAHDRAEHARAAFGEYIRSHRCEAAAD